jgi:hypothetical protein
MLQVLRPRVTFANLIAVACLFVVLGGDSFAAGAVKSATRLITGTDVKNDSLTGADIKNGSLTGTDVKNGSIAAADLAPGVARAGATGATGPKGDTGPAGAQGAKGLQGAPGLSGLEVVSSSSNSDPTDYKQQSVTCPAGKTAISGGASDAAASQPAPLALLVSQPGKNGAEAIAGQTPDGWFVAMNEESAYTFNWKVTAYAVCANVTP